MRKILISFLFISFFCFSKPIFIASFNTLRLGENEKDYKSLAKILKKFDLIALQEVMDLRSLKKLNRRLNKETNQKWEYILSPKLLGSQEYKEYYAFIFKSSIIDDYEILGVYKNGGSKEFIRDPFAVKFRSNKFDFVLINVHSIFGKNKKERRKEARNYENVYRYFQNISNEEDIILLGDFNLSSNDKAFNDLKENFNLKVLIDPRLFKTTISEKKLVNTYDNMFFNRNNLKEYTKRYGVYDFTKNNNKEIIKYISDHLLIFAEFENSKDLDKK